VLVQAAAGHLGLGLVPRFLFEEEIAAELDGMTRRSVIVSGEVWSWRRSPPSFC
jgi:hypothetical protein